MAQLIRVITEMVGKLNDNIKQGPYNTGLAFLILCGNDLYCILFTNINYARSKSLGQRSILWNM
jgi:hypothetical protein